MRTDSEGVAHLSVQARQPGPTRITARFGGDERLAAARADVTVTVTGAAQIYTPRIPAVSSAAGRVAPWVLSAMLATVWSLYFVVARLVLRIARAGDLPPRAEPEPDIARRRFLRELVPAGMHAAVVPVGLGLVTVIARSPYTHDNLEGHRLGRNYRRTPYAHVEKGEARERLPEVLAREVRFSREVLPILLANGGPHAVPPENSPPPGGVRLDSHEQIMRRKGLVVPGKPEESELVDVLVNPAMRMPPSIPPLPRQQIQLIVSWIAQGAKNT